MSFYDVNSFVPDRAVGYLVRAIAQASSARTDQPLAEEGLTNSQWQVLVSIYFNRALTCAALSRDLLHDKGAMTRLVDGLEERGWVTRERNAEDRRVFDLALTDEGRAVAERGRARVVACWNAWLTDWQPSEVETLIAMLQRLRTTVEAAS